jgi:predicted ATP-binding protein involved in virulence
MKIHQLEVRNFRGFEHQTFHFSDQFTVLIGENGTGKTAILDAIAIGAGCLFSRFDNFENLQRPISDDEVRRVRYEKGQTPTIEPQYPVSVSCIGVVDGSEITWERILQLLDRDNKGPFLNQSLYSHKIVNISKQLLEKVRKGEDVLLPLVAYYGTGRLWLQKKEESVETVKPGSRMLGYVDCLDPASNQKVLLGWFKTMEIATLQRGESLKVLDAVKAAIANCIEYCYSVKYDILEDELIATFNDGRTLPFRMLSDGVRNMLAMVADIAYRAAVLNPQLEIEAAKQTPGIVLIDEIDLHLHPKWQRRVVEDLRATFPAIQFVATTHSPFIVQSLRDGELINLDPQPAEEYHDKSIEDIAENVMGVEMPQKSERYLEMMEAAEEYYRVLQEAKEASPERLEELKARLDELTIPYSDDPAYQAFLKMEREAAGIGSGEKNETD